MALSRDAVFWDSFTQLAGKALEAAKLVEQMFNDPSQAKTLAERVKQLESEGDRITHEVVKALHKTWITPLDREEIHALISSLDDVLDSIDGAAARVMLYELRESNDEIKTLANVLVRSTSELAKVIDGLKTIKNAEGMISMCRDIGTLEDEADEVFRKAIARLFKEEKNAIEVMKWRDVFERLEAATDRAEDAANVIEGIVLEHA
jgi:predicted phosphate transport protein (TIGR00153 family)